MCLQTFTRGALRTAAQEWMRVAVPHVAVLVSGYLQNASCRRPESMSVMSVFPAHGI